MLRIEHANEASPLLSDRSCLPEISLAIGQCGKALAGPGVTCMASLKIARPIDRIVGFAKSASGEWIATIN
ncbi:hypothetical protein GOA71_12980 [Sinorhizobium meliloti]|nr:hypothetical protein [Sinorhizobium meliloti]